MTADGPTILATSGGIRRGRRTPIVFGPLLLRAIELSGAAGRAPRGVHADSYRTLRPFDDFIPKGADWREVFAKDLIARW